MRVKLEIAILDNKQTDNCVFSFSFSLEKLDVARHCCDTSLQPHISEQYGETEVGIYSLEEKIKVPPTGLYLHMSVHV